MKFSIHPSPNYTSMTSSGVWFTKRYNLLGLALITSTKVLFFLNETNWIEVRKNKLKIGSKEHDLN